MRANVFVTLRREVLDPQGKAVVNALRACGFDEVAEVRVGKYVEVDFAGFDGDRSQLEARVRSMCEKLLANPVIEDFRFDLEE